MAGIDDGGAIDLVTVDPAAGEYAVIMAEMRPWGSVSEQPDQLIKKVNPLRSVRARRGLRRQGSRHLGTQDPNPDRLLWPTRQRHLRDHRDGRSAGRRLLGRRDGQPSRLAELNPMANHTGSEVAMGSRQADRPVS